MPRKRLGSRAESDRRDKRRSGQLSQVRRRIRDQAGTSPARDTGRAMSQANVDLVKAILRAGQTDWEWVSSVLDPEVRLDQSRFPDGGVYSGRAAFGDFYRRWFGTWDDLTITPERFYDEGERVVVLLTVQGRGKGSGTPVTLRAANVWTVRDGKVIELVGYPDRAEALEAVGLSE